MHTPKEFLLSECESVRSVLQETLRYEYGTGGSQEFFEECEIRLDFIKQEIESTLDSDHVGLQTNSGLLSGLSELIARIERSSIGEYSWPFVNEVKRIANAICTQNTLVNPDAPSAPTSHEVIRGKKQKHERFDVPFMQSFLLHPGALALVPTLEWVKIPYDLQGVVTARSSWAREGLSIATATIVNPGYIGIVTLELANLGEVPIRLYPGLRLAQIAFYRLESKDSTADQALLKSQFDMSFEPSGGNIAKDDSPFIPSLKP